jgi:hypothetical protein
MTEKSQHTYRLADGDDHTAILAVLEEVAPEIPVDLSTPAHLDAMKNIIAECCASGESWVAVDASGTVVGFLLVKADVFERAIHRNNALSLRYAGVSKSSRQCGVFAVLMENLMSGKSAPINTSVLHANQCAMADLLNKIGFDKVEADAKETRFRWLPAP